MNGTDFLAEYVQAGKWDDVWNEVEWDIWLLHRNNGACCYWITV